MSSDQELRLKMLMMMTSAFRNLENSVPPPQMTKISNGSAMRYREKLPVQAVVMKLARVISGLNALALLHQNGFLQEQAVLQRTLDEIDEDVMFIGLAEFHDDYTKLHKEYFEAFWAEEFNHAIVMRSTQTRAMPRRDKIRAYNTRLSGGNDPSTANTALRIIYKTYSGYVHAAAPQVMDLYVGFPPRFQTSGISDPYRLKASYDETWAYFYRGYCTVCLATLIFGRESDTIALLEFRREIEKLTGIGRE